MRVLLPLAFCGGHLLTASGHDHPHFTATNPDAVAWQPLPLNLSYSKVSLEVNGTVPDYLTGTLYRGAPAAWPDGWWLDGLITLNAFKFSQGTVTYTMQWNKDDAWKQTLKGEPFLEVLDKPNSRGGLLHHLNNSWPTGVAFHKVDGSIVGSTGVSNINSFDPDTLDPKEMPFMYSDDLGGPYFSPTHEQTIDGYSLGHISKSKLDGQEEINEYIITSIKPGSRARDVIAEIKNPTESSPHGYPSFQHMTYVTSEYYIMQEAACYYPTHPTPLGNVEWAGWRSDPLAKTHLRLVSRKTGESLIYPVSYNIFSIHHINAFHDEESNSVILDTIQTFPSVLPCSMAFNGLTLKKISTSPTEGLGLHLSKPVRMVVPLDKPGATVTPKLISDNITGIEFPTISYDSHNGKPYNYVYATKIHGLGSNYYDALAKLNVNTGENIIWHRDLHYPGEPIFVPDPKGSEEDDGVVITNVLDATKKESYLLVLDAKSMTEVAKAGPTPHVIPHGFHGRYYAEAAAVKQQEIIV